MEMKQILIFFGVAISLNGSACVSHPYHFSMFEPTWLGLAWLEVTEISF
jgi:hypothetical protein